MELKSYQKKVIADLTRYLELLNETKSDAAAFRLFWQEKSAPALGRYQNVIPGVPNLCFKVPTGGGKTFIACNAVRPIFDALPATKTKEVVCITAVRLIPWLVYLPLLPGEKINPRGDAFRSLFS